MSPRCSGLLLAVLASVAAACAIAPGAVAAPPTDAPANMHVTAVSARSFSVVWDQPASPGTTGTTTCLIGPGVAGIQIGGCGNYPGEIHTSYSAINLVCGSTYTVQAAWMSALGEMGPYATLGVSTSPCTRPAPAAPTGLHVMAATGSTIDVAWDPPASTGVQSTGRWFSTPGLGTSPLQRGGGVAEGSVQTSYGLTKLLCGTTYGIEVAWVSDEGVSSARSGISAQTASCDTLGPVPPPPTGLRISAATGSSFTFAWDPAPAGDPVVSVRVTLTSPGHAEDRIQPGGVASYPMNTSYLPCATSYDFRVSWIWADGRQSLPASIATPATPACPMLPVLLTGGTRPPILVPRAKPLPRLTAVVLTKRTFVAGARGVVLRFTLNERATVTIALLRKQSGKRRGALCVKPTPALRHARSCTRLVNARTRRVVGNVGTNAVKLATKGLKPGSYLARLRARVGTDGRTSSSVSVPFTIRAASHR